MHESQVRPAVERHEFDLDRGRPWRHRVRLALTLLPAPGVDKPPRRVELHELATRGVAGNDLDPIRTAWTRLERRLLAHPRRRLVGVDEELPDRLRACVDRQLLLDLMDLSCAFPACSSPLVPPLASTPRDDRPRSRPGTPSARPSRGYALDKGASCR